MKNECSIIRDILPLYVENMVSEDTSEFVKEHLESCPACRAELEKLREPVEMQTEPQPDMDAAPLKRLKKALLMKKVQTILCTAAVLLALVRGVETVTAFVREVMQWGGVESALFAPLFKTVAIALISRTGADLCRDAGEGAMASLVETAGAFGAVVVSLPLFGAVWELLSGMI